MIQHKMIVQVKMIQILLGEIKTLIQLEMILTLHIQLGKL